MDTLEQIKLLRAQMQELVGRHPAAVARIARRLRALRGANNLLEPEEISHEVMTEAIDENEQLGPVNESALLAVRNEMNRTTDPIRLAELGRKARELRGHQNLIRRAPLRREQQ